MPSRGASGIVAGMTRRLSLLSALALLSLAAACDSPPATDAGTDGGTPALLLVATGSEYIGAVNGVAARAGFQYQVIDITFFANAMSAPVAPSAFTLRFEDLSMATGDSATDAIPNGCTSQQVAAGSSLDCRIVFEVPMEPSPATTLEWRNGNVRLMTAAP